MNKNIVTIVVLNDGETFTDISGCRILKVREDEFYATINSGGDARDMTPVESIDIEDLLSGS